jgi:hypothetical protein
MARTTPGHDRNYVFSLSDVIIVASAMPEVASVGVEDVSK